MEGLLVIRGASIRKFTKRRLRMYIGRKLYFALIFFIVICSTFSTQITFAQNTLEVKSEIYSKLKCCFCQESFDICTCPEAKEIKAYVDALLESGTSKGDIFYKVAKKFSLKIIHDKQIKQSIENKLIQEAGKNRPQVLLESESFDFGRVNRKQGKISKSFKLSNKGDSTLVIKNIKTFCPCATVSLKVNKKKSPYFGIEGAPENWDTEIKPGKTGALELVIDLNSEHVKTGKLIREASLFTNDPVYPEVTVRVEAEVSD